MAEAVLIGFGAIGAAIVRDWHHLGTAYSLAALCVRPSQVAAAQNAAPAGTRIVTSVDEALQSAGDVVIEAAGHAALRDVAAAILESGRDLYTLSIGALADGAFDKSLQEASAAGGGRLIVPSGALAGFDGLMSLREAGLEAVTYTSTKPPHAWQGTAADDLVDLETLTAPATFFRGTAREAATMFPKNANLAAAVALAGLGFDRTRVELVVDPGATGNAGAILARTPHSELTVTLRGQSLEGNPKSSAIVSSSMLSALKNSVARISFGSAGRSGSVSRAYDWAIG